MIALLGLLLPLSAIAQQVKIQGKVTSATDNSPMMGVVVTVVGTKTVVLTDVDGNYTIQPKASSGQLRFTYIGCKPTDKAFNGAAIINVAMEDNNTLGEAVAIGYGTMRKSDLTGSVATINGEEMSKVPASGLDQALQGRAAGVTVNLNSGQPGGEAQVRIRGIGTVNDASPIYVVDGVIVDNISFLSPSDIASTEVLKDASSTAIYGSRGANGVILVTTKTGKDKGHSEISYDGYVGWQTRANTIDLMGRDEMMETMMSMTGTAKSQRNYYNKYGFNAWLNRYHLGNDTHYPTIYSETNPTGIDYGSINTDWQDEVFRTAFMQSHHVSIDGATEKAQYSFSGSYFDQDGTMIGSDFKRYTIRANTSFQVRSWLKIGESATYSYSKGRTAMNNNASPNASILSAAIAMAPWDPARYPAGSVNKNGDDLSGQISAASNFKNVTNPLSTIEYYHPRNVNERVVADIFAEITFPVKGLTFRTDVSGDLTYYRARSVTDKYEVSSYDKAEHSFISTASTRYSTVIWNNILTYARDIKDHRFSVMVGQTGEEYNVYGVSGSGKDISNANDPNHWYLNQTATGSRNAGDEVTRTRRTSWLGRLFYSYKDKYLATFNFRADGSNKFPNNTWGYFPSLALAWRMSQESWMQQFKNLDYFKVRAGWGRIGNDKIGNDAFNQTMYTTGPTFVGYVFGKDQSLSDGASVITYVNQGGKWELTETWNLGFDFSFFRGMLTGTVEGFIRNTKDMLLTVKGPAYIGNMVDAQANVGTVSNKGIELQLGHHNRIGQFNYTIDLNASYVHNELTGLNGGEKQYGAYTINDEGYALYTFYGYKYKGVYQTDEEAAKAMWGYGEAGSSTQIYHAGDAIYEDLNGDGKIDANDKTDIGNPFPKWTFGLNLTAEWRGFDFSMFWQGQAGNKIYNALRIRTEGNGNEATLSTKMSDVWRNVYDADGNITAQVGSIPNPYGNSDNNAASSRFVENGSYLRLKTLQLGYSIPADVISKYGLSRCRFYVSGTNLCTITGYSGYDPEVSGGVDYGNYPQSRTFLMGVQLAF